MYPIYLNLQDRRVVIIGAGSVAARKALPLLEANARLTIVSEKIDQQLQSLCDNNNIKLIKMKYSKNYLLGATLAIAATNDKKLNRQIYRDCQELEVLCNVVDDPALCDFFTPAVIRQGDLQIAIGTDGNCPAYAGHLRQKLMNIITEEHGRFLAELEKLREKVITQIDEADKRKTILGKLVSDESFEYFKKNGPAAFNDRAEKIIQQQND